MADPIDTDAERDDACHCRDVVSVPGPKLGVTYHFSDCRVDEISALCDEVDHLRSENSLLLGVIERVADLCDDQRSEDAYQVLHDVLEADRG